MIRCKTTQKRTILLFTYACSTVAAPRHLSQKLSNDDISTPQQPMCTTKSCPIKNIDECLF